MSRQRGDVHELGPGPLFETPIERLVGRTDPATSRKAAGDAKAAGTVKGDAAYLLALIRQSPGSTMAEIGATAARERGGDAFQWRLKLGRRTGPLLDARAVHVDGERDGKGQWWPGRRPEASE